MITWLLISIVALLIGVLLVMCSLEPLANVAFLCMIVAGVVSCSESDSWRKQQQQQAEEYRKEAKPHVIREADGCKVYAFKTDREHYFTRCGGTVTTETNWSQSCGKSCSKQMSDTITTEGNK